MAARGRSSRVLVVVVVVVAQRILASSSTSSTPAPTVDCRYSTRQE